MRMRTFASADMLHMELKQLGASEVKDFPVKAVSVFFDIKEGVRVSYFLNIRDENKISLQRVDPYPVKNIRFKGVEDIIEFIKFDVEMFRNAANSKNFDRFLDIIEKNYQVRAEMEELFLQSNVPTEVLEKFESLEDEYLEKLRSVERVKL